MNDTPLPHRCPIGETCPLSAQLAAVAAERNKWEADALLRAQNTAFAQQQRDEARAERDKLRAALESIKEYWNLDCNDKAMRDACYHAVETAHDALAALVKETE